MLAEIQDEVCKADAPVQVCHDRYMAPLLKVSVNEEVFVCMCV